MVDINKIITSAMKSGKIFIGSKQAIIASKTGRAIAFIVSSDCPAETISKIQASSKVPIYTYPDSSLELGIACSKHFHISVLTIREIGDLELLKTIQESTKINEVT